MHPFLIPMSVLAVGTSALVLLILRAALGPASRFALKHIVQKGPFRHRARARFAALLIWWWFSMSAVIGMLRGWF